MEQGYSVVEGSHTGIDELLKTVTIKCTPEEAKRTIRIAENMGIPEAVIRSLKKKIEEGMLG